jgi:ABC-type Fe3+/spermidine/putrescine transport system ATPase subunit
LTVPISAAETDALHYGGLSVRGLTAGAGSFRLGPVDLTVPPGRVLVVLGPSGAGKTMLLETICGLRQQLCGQIRLSGAELTGLAPERRGIGLVFQDAALFPHLSVRENVRFGPRARGRTADAATADSLLRRVGIGHLANRSPRTLSGGERQRVALARALAIRPRLLLLDEPLSALDQPTREEMRAFLQDVLADLDIPAVHVTHDRDEALSIGDDLAIIIGGRLAQAGPAGQVTAAPADQAAARLLGWVHLGSGTIAEPGTVRAGQFTFPDVTDPQATGTVQVYYRPEDVLLDSHPEDSSGTGADGVVTVIGGIVPTRPLARISLASDPPLTALVLHRDLERLQARAGDPVTAALPRASVRVFPTALEASHPGAAGAISRDVRATGCTASRAVDAVPYVWAARRESGPRPVFGRSGPTRAEASAATVKATSRRLGRQAGRLSGRSTARPGVSACGRQRYIAGPLSSGQGDCYFFFPFLFFLFFLLFLAMRITPLPDPCGSTKC